MELKFIKKMLAVLCAATMSMSCVAGSVGAIEKEEVKELHKLLWHQTSDDSHNSKYKWYRQAFGDLFMDVKALSQYCLSSNEKALEEAKMRLDFINDEYNELKKREEIKKLSKKENLNDKDKEKIEELKRELQKIKDREKEKTKQLNINFEDLLKEITSYINNLNKKGINTTELSNLFEEIKSNAGVLRKTCESDKTMSSHKLGDYVDMLYEFRKDYDKIKSKIEKEEKVKKPENDKKKTKKKIIKKIVKKKSLNEHNKSLDDIVNQIGILSNEIKQAENSELECLRCCNEKVSELNQKIQNLRQSRKSAKSVEGNEGIKLRNGILKDIKAIKAEKSELKAKMEKDIDNLEKQIQEKRAKKADLEKQLNDMLK